MTPIHWIGPVIVVSVIAGFVIGGFVFWSSGVLEGRKRELLKRKSDLQDELSGYTEIKYERRVKTTYVPEVESAGSSMPTRQEVRRAAQQEHANAMARDWQCHDSRCEGKGKHRCHNLDCKMHKVQS